MSVINKVLRDLDNRAVGAGRTLADGPSGAAGAQLPPGVAAVPPLPPPASPRQRPRGRAVPLLVLLSVLGLAVAIWWWQGPRAVDAAPQTAAVVAVPAPPTPLPAAPSVAVAPAATPVAAEAPGGGSSDALFPPGMARPEVLAPLPAPLATPAATVVAAAPAIPSSASVATPAPAVNTLPAPVARQSPPAPAVVASAPVRLAGAVPAAPAAPASAAVPKPAIEKPPVAAPSPLPWPEAALDAVAQAQRMWGSGARDTSLAFLRDALGGVERAHGPDLLPDRDGAVAGLAMVRELVRMEQTLGNHAQVLALLKRHEVLAARHADLWAVRGSAAQRLSQHADAADSYRTALRLRPGEPRWMLGAAVSLAALGKVADATQLVEQARAIGPVSPDVLSYLRQLGVQARSDNQGN